MTWRQWFDEESIKEFQEYGYYQQKFRTSDGRVHDKVRVIGLNTQACYTMNVYLWA